MVPDVAELRDDGPDAVEVRRDVQAALGGDLLALFGDQGDLVRPHLFRDRDDVVREGHLQVIGPPHDLFQGDDIAVLDVAPVLAQVHGDAVGAACLAEPGPLEGVGVGGAARLAHGGYMVDVHAQLDLRHGPPAAPAQAFSSSPSPAPSSE